MTLLRKGNNTKNISATVNMSLREDIMKLWLPREPEEAVQQHDQEAANGSHVQVRDVQVIIYDKKL